MSKTFRPWDIERQVLLAVDELVPAGHLARFVRDTVREELDLSRIMETYSEERGYPPYHPAMMVALLLYAYSRGAYSSRKIAQACEERVDFMAVTAMNRPDHRTIARFRRRHLKALGDLFVQVLKLCRATGLVKLGHVALDGTKIQANASVHKAMSYGRMREAEERLKAGAAAWFSRAEATDVEEDRVHGADRRGDEMPDWVAQKAQRVERIRAAKAVLEAEAKQGPPDDDDGPGPSSGMMKNGRPQRGPDGSPPDRAQRNFTDPDSRIQPVRAGVIQGYNAQIAVDGAHQIIIAQRLQTNPADRRGLKPLLAAAPPAPRAHHTPPPGPAGPKPAAARRARSAGRQPEGSLGRRWVLRRNKSGPSRPPQDRRLSGGCPRAAHAIACGGTAQMPCGLAHGRHGDQAQARWTAQPLSLAQADCRTGVWSD